MRILLTSNASYDPPRGGSTRSNLAWLDVLSSAGNQCRVVATGAAHQLTRQGGIEILSVPGLSRHTDLLKAEIRAFAPDWVLVSSEDVGHVLLRSADEAAPGRIVYLAHTPQFFPFGPAAWHREEIATAVVQRAAGVIAIGRHMARYIEEHTGRKAEVIHPPIYGALPYRLLGAFNNDWVLTINPCQVKGIEIFLALAERFPDCTFAALRGWGTTRADEASLARLSNIHILDSVPDIEDVLARARVLLMPSLWYEGFGLIAMEAMLRGIPVIASDSGGLAECKQGTGYVIPINPIQGYEAEFDETHMPKPKLGPQNIEPWAAALNTLLKDPQAWQEESQRSRVAAMRFVSGIEANAIERFLSTLAGSTFGDDHTRKLRILLAHNSLYFPSTGGGDKSNRLLMEALADRGHEVRVVARIENFSDSGQARLLAELQARGFTADSVDSGVVQMNFKGVDVHTLAANPNLRAYFSDQISIFNPDVIVTSTDDPAQLLLDIALRSPRARVVHLVRATIAVPFGWQSSSPDPRRAGLLKRVDAVVAVSEAVAKYCREEGGLKAIHLPISLMENPRADPEDLGSFNNEFITMVNPSAVKGLSIFLDLARRLPGLRFAAVRSWGSTSEDLAALRALPNVTLLDPVDDIRVILKRTRVLLVPSVWVEARSRIVVEAMMHGVPVVASDVGGIPEAKLGVPYLIPVNPIRRYTHAVTSNMVPIAEVPAQNIDPWIEAIEKLTGDPVHYADIAAWSRRAALEYVHGLSVEPFERLLESLVRQPKQDRLQRTPPVNELSSVKKRLLTLRLAQARTKLWFPYLAPLPDKAMRLFTLPHAGAGASQFRKWAMPERVALSPVCLPGREARIRETPYDSMPTLIAALATEIAPYTRHPYALFGHSMGAGIAFELARELQRRSLPSPAALFVSSARAPRLRIPADGQRDPSDEELLDELRRLGGIPSTEPEALETILPALRVDTRLYRNYRYQPGSPLNMPLFIYGATDDPALAPELLDAWLEVTTGPVIKRLFQGGHFYLFNNSGDFLAEFHRDLAAVLPACRSSLREPKTAPSTR
jgi:surfactin synthase thioesterase subunit/glycosyltransferase involved in cell wall biosynthesis